MFWKVLGAVVLVWLVFVLLGLIIKGLFWLITLGVLGVGVYLLFKSGTGAGKARQR